MGRNKGRVAMPNFNRYSDNQPFRGEQDYQIAHEVCPELFDYLFNSIESIVLHESTAAIPSQDKFRSTNDGLTAMAFTEHLIDTCNETTRAHVSHGLRVDIKYCKPPSCHRIACNIRALTYISTVKQPIITDYCIEKLSSDAYFGTMRRYCFGIAATAAQVTNNPAGFGKLENMTVYDLIELDTLLTQHQTALQEQAEFANFIQSDE